MRGYDQVRTAARMWVCAMACVLGAGDVAGSSTVSAPAARTYATLDDWIKREAIPTSAGSLKDFHAVVDKVVHSFGNSVELLGFGEAMHGSEDILQVRNRFFQRLVEAHGYSAIAIESGFPEGHRVDEYIAGGPGPYQTVAERGFSWSFGRLEANRELVEWMRQYNADPSHKTKLHFYGFDISAIGGARIHGPDAVLHLALDYLASVDPTSARERRQRVDALLSQLSGWENADAWIGKAKPPGLLPAATTLRIETEDLITELRTRRPELVAKTGQDRYLEALQYALVARQTLAFHAALARSPAEPPAGVRGVRDALMADNLAYIVDREKGHGKVFVFAHNGHLQRGKSVWPCCGQKYRGTDVYEWWPAGAQLHSRFGSRYAVIGTGVGTSDPNNGLGAPELDTLEARLTALPGPLVFIPTYQGQGSPAAEIARLKIRAGSSKNLSYTTLEARSFTDFDWWAVFDTTEQTRQIQGSPSRQGG